VSEAKATSAYEKWHALKALEARLAFIEAPKKTDTAKPNAVPQ